MACDTFSQGSRKPCPRWNFLLQINPQMSSIFYFPDYLIITRLSLVNHEILLLPISDDLLWTFFIENLRVFLTKIILNYQSDITIIEA